MGLTPGAQKPSQTYSNMLKTADSLPCSQIIRITTIFCHVWGSQWLLSRSFIDPYPRKNDKLETKEAPKKRQKKDRKEAPYEEAFLKRLGMLYAKAFSLKKNNLQQQ